MSSRKTSSKSDERSPPKHKVITLRIPDSAQRKLLDHCTTRTKKEGKPVSYNRAIIDLIEAS
jgi:hypothetical protein